MAILFSMKGMAVWLVVAVLAAVSRAEECNFQTGVEPTSYWLEIAPRPQERTFSGRVKIVGRVKPPCLLHSAVNVTSLSVTDLVSGSPVNTSFVEDPDGQLLLVDSAEGWNSSSLYQLDITYLGEIRSKLGIFLTSYRDKNGSESEILATELQSTYARYAFPCVDQPGHKAEFTLRLARPIHLTALSNMPLKQTSPPDPDIGGQVWDEFERTPPMSTYGLCFVVWPVTSDRLDSETHRLWLSRDHSNMDLLFSSAAPRLLKALEIFTGLPYPLPKLDHVALPSLVSVAMENWGIITYREDILLVDANEAGAEDQLSLVTLIAHELAHQWFGNLVTCHSWGLTWLNEALPTFLQAVIVEMVWPDWQATEVFLAHQVYDIMFAESITPSMLTNSRVCSNEEVHRSFSSPTYYKGAAIIRMVQHILSTDVLKEGLTKYLKSNSYGSVKERDLWDSLESSGGPELPTSLGEIMASWTHNPGFPVLNVHRNDSSVYLTQEQFLMFSKENSQRSWWIPVSYTTGEDNEEVSTSPREWFNPEEAYHQLNLTLQPDDWIVINLQFTGFFRVNYMGDGWELLRDELCKGKNGRLDPLTRANLLQDSFALAVAGQLEYTAPLRLTSCLKHETEFAPWQAAISSLQAINNWCHDTRLSSLLEEYGLRLVKDIYSMVSEEEGKDPVSKLLRSEVVKFACELGHQPCLEWGLRSVQQPELRLSIEVRESVLCAGVRAGGEPAWLKILSRYMAASSSIERATFFHALVCTQEDHLIKRTLKDTFEKASYLGDESDVSDLISLFYKGKHLSMMLEYIQDHYNDIEKLHGTEALEDYIEKLSLQFLSSDFKAKFATFLENHPELSNQEELLKQASKENAWIKLHYSTVEDWLVQALDDSLDNVSSEIPQLS